MPHSQNSKAGKRTHIITAENILDESYYNLVQLCRITGYADPLAAIRATGERFEVVKDACGNILSGIKRRV